ncbi:MAG: hypothetical protein GWM98_29900 [Nitrospinaceae bacterium]|nr:hypothetical protein [Nitrospinaceae bacterium]NIR57910.1 hypothetical protein [Nitrospinaceae bacterium]NIS88368.1 hypothetical protein [Nitrospinaceae bacterium]NIT85246.1 hypothetical protein [Nitrospinaceae bacterium]NIU47399.1 hypothetical protein [Nitrospinaceae bacterium]
MNWLQGKKTYIVSGLMVMASLTNLIAGDMGVVEFFSSSHLNTLLEGIGLGTLRAGVSKTHGY